MVSAGKFSYTEPIKTKITMGKRLCDVLAFNDGVDTSKTDILGHSHPTKTVIGENGLAYTFTATNPSQNDISAFANYSTNIISGNLESQAVTKNKDGTYNTPKNTQGGVFYNSSGNQILSIDSKAINKILSNYENGQLKQ